MRTLKKVLALSLVFAMAFTLMAGAAFKDEDSIDSSLRDDITLLEALGVFQGDENGNFNPTNNVTRAEAAKMIYVLKNNGVDDEAVAFKGVATFSDVPVGHWAEGYVNYCANLGIMAGWTENGQKVFNPNGNVTGVEMTKMLLCLVGYRADVQGYTNNNSWQTNVLMDGANSGITSNYTPSVYAAAPRQWTARLMVNAINAPFVTYNRGEIMYGTMNDPTASYGLNYLQLGIARGTLTATNTVRISGSIDDKGVVTTGSLSSSLRGTNQDEVTVGVVQVNNGEEHEPVSTNYEISGVDNSLLGQKVRVYYRQTSITDTTPRSVFAVLADSSENVVNTTVDQISFSSTNHSNMTVEGEGTMTYSEAHPVTLYVDYAAVAPKSGDDAWTFTKTGDGNNTIYEDYLGVNSSASAKVVYDKDGYVTAIYISSDPVYAVVDEIDAENGVFRLIDAENGAVNLYEENGTTRITFNRANSENFADYLNIDSSVAAEDVVKITKNLSTGELKYDVTVLNAVNSDVQSYTTKDGNYDTMTIDGTAYELDANAMNAYDWSTGAGAAGHDTFYVDGSYVVYSTGESASASISNLAYVFGTGASEDSFGSITMRVKVVLADGTKGSYVLSKSAGVGDRANDGMGKNDSEAIDKPTNAQKKTALDSYNNGIYTYSLRDNTITLRTIETKPELDGNRATYLAGGQIGFDESEGTATVGSDEYVINDSTYFFVQDTTESGDDQYAVIKASELKKDIEASGLASPLIVAQKISGFETILAGFIQSGNLVTTEAEDYYFVTDVPSYVGENSDGDYVINLPVNAAGTDTVLEFKYSDDGSIDEQLGLLNDLVGKLVNVDLESDGSVAEAADVTVVSAVAYSESVADKNDQWIIGDLTAWSSTRATIGGNNFKVAEDVKIFNVDVKNNNTEADFEGEGSAVRAEAKTGEGESGNYTNAVFVRNTDGEISAIFTEIEGMDISFVVDVE